uniref:DNA-directed DNA polymerase n=3 Tax=Helianthus annuus TaxID=4232 RepID=A0A2R4IRV6_HELAN|nr:orf2565 [Helianthus annuus]
MNQSFGEEITYTLGSAIPLTSNDGALLPKNEIYARVKEAFLKNAELYNGSCLVQVIIRAYMDQVEKQDRPELKVSDRYQELLSIYQTELGELEAITARKIQHSKGKYKDYITALKKASGGRRAFMVSDLETILIDNKHRPYAAGLMLVHPGKDVKESLIYTYFSEDYSRYIESFEERSKKVLFDLVNKIIALVKIDRNAKIVYFHNFSRFDGVLVLKHLVCHHDYKLKPLFRNNRLYELSVYSGRKLLFRLRDSLNLLPGTLNNLAKSLCPSLGSKGSLDYQDVRLDNLVSKKDELIEYMKQDILLLGGIMQKAQEIYFHLYQLDIVSKITLSSLALSIYRLKYYDEENWPIYIPNMNQDNFIRKAYYGGHTDTYKPYGEDLYYYDVNSLYPFVMKNYQMPGGKPVWHGNLDEKDLDSLYGFIEAYVVCPKTIKKPFLPYRNKNNTLTFPTGEFVGVYYSEELKFARDLGYTVLPLSGYLYERMDSPFIEFVNTQSEKRIEAKKAGNEALSFVYKILMNSLYGRFGINPNSTTSEICDHDRYRTLFKKDSFIYGSLLEKNKYIVSYHVNTGNTPETWNPPKNGAVQLAAAITACARIYMYPYISREECYYTDTDSVVLGQPLPDELISSSVLGMLKLEARIVKGYFLAPKSYGFIEKDADGKIVLKHKGAAKSLVTLEWFQSQYDDPSRKEQVSVTSNFKIDWKDLEIQKQESLYKLGLSMDSKRLPVYNSENTWIDTEPIHIRDLSNVSPLLGDRILFYLRNEMNRLQTKSEILSEKLSQRDREMIGIISEKDREISEMKSKIDHLQDEMKKFTKETTKVVTKIKVVKSDNKTKKTKVVKKTERKNQTDKGKPP